MKQTKRQKIINKRKLRKNNVSAIPSLSSLPIGNLLVTSALLDCTEEEKIAICMLIPIAKKIVRSVPRDKLKESLGNIEIKLDTFAEGIE